MAIIGWGLTTYIEVLSKNGVPMKKASFISQILSMPFIINCYLRGKVWEHRLAPCQQYWLMHRIQVIVSLLLVNMSFLAQCLKS